MVFFETTKEITDNVFDTLNEICSELTFVKSFPGELTNFPINSPTVALGVNEIKILLTDNIFNGEDRAGYHHYESVANCDYSLKICVPKDLPGERCYEAFDLIADACMQIENAEIVDIRCNGIKYDRIMGAIVLTAGITLNAIVGCKIETAEWDDDEGENDAT